MEESFQHLREAMEDELGRANDSRPTDLTGSVRTAYNTKVLLAPDEIAERFLRLTSGFDSPRQ
ncbi:MAG: hypothetical protein J5861_03085 [Desulfovibrio sp.]|nr:hypothetical protein [Desulfovibrio sp.]